MVASKTSRGFRIRCTIRICPRKSTCLCGSARTHPKKLACAYYKVAYGAYTSYPKSFLSFAWLGWEVVNLIRCENLHKEKKFYMISNDPLGDRLSKHINSVYELDGRKVIIDLMLQDAATYRYCSKYKGKI